MPRDDATGHGPPAPSWWAKQGPVPSSCPCTKRQTKCSLHHPRIKSQAGWGLSGSLCLLPVLQLWSPRVTTGHGRSSILRGVPGRALQAGRKAPPLSPQPRPHLGSAGGSARPAPGSSESGPPPYAPRGPPAGLVARAAPRPEAIRPGGVVCIGPTQEGRVTVAQGQTMEFRLALPSLLCFSFFPPPGEMGQVSALSLSYILQPCTLMFLPRKRGNCTPPPTPGPVQNHAGTVCVK